MTKIKIKNATVPGKLKQKKGDDSIKDNYNECVAISKEARIINKQKKKEKFEKNLLQRKYEKTYSSKNDPQLHIEDDPNNKDSDDDDIRPPTNYELKESEKPENTINITTVRKQKIQKHQKNLQVHESKIQQKDIEKIENYLLSWKNQHHEWKFQKVKQILIQNSIFDEEKITNKLWPIALEYLSGSKGKSKDYLIKLTETKINQLDDEIEKTQNKELFNRIVYKRARELLQLLE